MAHGQCDLRLWDLRLSEHFTVASSCDQWQSTSQALHGCLATPNVLGWVTRVRSSKVTHFMDCDWWSLLVTLKSFPLDRMVCTFRPPRLMSLQPAPCRCRRPERFRSSTGWTESLLKYPGWGHRICYTRKVDFFHWCLKLSKAPLQHLQPTFRTSHLPSNQEKRITQQITFIHQRPPLPKAPKNQTNHTATLPSTPKCPGPDLPIAVLGWSAAALAPTSLHHVPGLVAKRWGWWRFF